MKVRHKGNGVTYPTSQASWDSIVANGKAHLFEVIEHDAETKVIAKKEPAQVLQEKATKKGPVRPAKNTNG